MTQDWMFYTQEGENPRNDMATALPAPPPWRDFQTVSHQQRDVERGKHYLPDTKEVEMVNAALYLRRPLLVTGKPGSGKSSLAYSVAYRLGLGRVLRWTITSHTTLLDGLYSYDAIGRLHQASMEQAGESGGWFGRKSPSANIARNIGNYLTLGPLGTALLQTDTPRVLLIDEIDKSDIDLPNNLLNIFEEGEFDIPELARMPDATITVKTYNEGEVEITRGKVRCTTFPFVVMTSNGERDFPPAFLRRCLQLQMKQPDDEKLLRIVNAHLGKQKPQVEEYIKRLIKEFIERRDDQSDRGDMATDQLLNAVYIALNLQHHNIDLMTDLKPLLEQLLCPLGNIDEDAG